MKRIESSALISRVRFDLRNALAVSLLFFLGATPCHTVLAHDSLYNYVEFHLLENGRLEVTFSVHAADLVDSPDVDPTSTDMGWYSALTTSERSALCDQANQFLTDSYRLCEGESASPQAIPLPSVTEADSLETGPRPGCLLATLEFEYCPRSLSLNYGATDKRLMLIVTRSGTFPKVHDVAPGGSHILQLNTH